MDGFFYRLIMRIAHRFHWHYAPPIYPDGDTQLWCRWCGFRQTVKRKSLPDISDEVVEMACEAHWNCGLYSGQYEWKTLVEHGDHRVPDLRLAMRAALSAAGKEFYGQHVDSTKGSFYQAKCTGSGCVR